MIAIHWRLLLYSNKTMNVSLVYTIFRPAWLPVISLTLGKKSNRCGMRYQRTTYSWNITHIKMQKDRPNGLNVHIVLFVRIAMRCDARINDCMSAYVHALYQQPRIRMKKKTDWEFQLVKKQMQSFGMLQRTVRSALLFIFV